MDLPLKDLFLDYSISVQMKVMIKLADSLKRVYIRVMSLRQANSLQLEYREL